MPFKVHHFCLVYSLQTTTFMGDQYGCFFLFWCIWENKFFAGTLACSSMAPISSDEPDIWSDSVSVWIGCFCPHGDFISCGAGLTSFDIKEL